jgi:hypothetical protein
MLLTALLISSCATIPIQSTDTELTLKSGERWEIESLIVLPSSASLSLGQFESNLEQSLSQYRSRGIVASWYRLPQNQGDSNISYKLQMAGRGYQLLNQTIFSGQSATSLIGTNSNQVEFRYSPSSSTFFQGQHNTFKLTSKKVIETNGSLLNSNTVAWTDPIGDMTATVLAGTDLKLLWIILLGLGGIGLLFAGLGLSDRLSNWPLPTTPTRTNFSPIPPSSGFNTKYCPNCGSLNPEKAEFCTKCGRKFPL